MHHRTFIARALGVVRVLAFGILLALAWLTLRGWAFADDPPPRRPTAAEVQLVSLVARVTFNEAGTSADDLAVIWQIVEARGSTARERLAWLAAHSPCVSGRLSQDEAYRRPGRCRWTRNLTPDGRRPRGYDRAREGVPWSAVRPRWLEHVERVRRYVLEGEAPILCPVAPATWDGARWRDRVEARGWRVLECKGEARNVAAVRP